MPNQPESKPAPQPAAAADAGDRALLARLRHMYEEIDPVPEHLALDSLIAATVANLDAELAELAAPVLVGVRDDGRATVDAITFQSHGDVSLTVSSDGPDDTLTLDGWVTPGGATIEVHRGGTVQRVVADDHGRFIVADLPRGPVWFVVWPDGPDGDRRALVTPSVTL